MSPIGKIFAVINLILAAAFLGWASNALATSGDYKTRLEKEQDDHASTKQQGEEERAKLTTQNTELDAARARFRQEKEDAANEAERHKNDLESERETNRALRASIDKIQADLGDFVANNKTLEEAKSRAVQAQNDAQTQLADAQRAQQQGETAMREAQQQLTVAQRDIEELRAQNNTLQNQVASLDAKVETVLVKTGLTWEEIGGVQASIEARVLDVDRSIQPGLVALNVGEGAGVKRGYVFHVYRGSDYIGKVRIENVRESMSTGLIEGTYKGREIRQGDAASTHL
jgi:multidrug efflux pump subunit AcrA (membrane-fusion protein)